MVCQLKYDSVHNQFTGTISSKEAESKEFLVVNGVEAQIFHEKNPAAIPWGRERRGVHLRVHGGLHGR